MFCPIAGTCSHGSGRAEHDLIGAWSEAPSMSCLRHPAGAYLRQGRHHQHDIGGGTRHSGPGRARRGRLPCRHPPRGGHQRHGGHLADAEFTTTVAGYAAALAFLEAHGHVIAIGVEGTSSYGAGFTRAARAAGLHVVEVNRPDRAERRRVGKSDPITPTPPPVPPCPDGPPAHPRTTPSPAYAPCTTPPAPPSRPAPPP